MAQVINIFNFLKEYNQLTNPVVTEIDKQKFNLDLSDLPCIEEINSVFIGNDIDELVFLEVTKPSLEPCPKPDDSLIEWITNDWKKLSIDIVIHKTKIVREIQNQDQKEYIEELFENDIERVGIYNKWTKVRDLWREKELPRDKGLKLYNKLFTLYSDMKKEAESVELILGDGVIRWNIDDRVINHPVLLQKVILEFEPKAPKFIVKCEEIKTEIYSAMLRVLSSINQKMLTDIIQDVDKNNYSIPDFINTHSLYKRLIHIIDNSGEFVEREDSANSNALIYSNPVLFLRKRTLGYSAFLENIIEEINNNGEVNLPTFFGNMVGNHKEDDQTAVIEAGWNHSGIDEDILLTLPANNEQLKIIKYLNSYGAVLVQGPPGTGKTHTIANLIGHLLSQGNSVLVTSHTEKALSVLKEKVYKDQYDQELNLQSLCISLLSSKSQKKEMDEAINEIASKGTTIDLHEAKQRIDRLKTNRKLLIEESKKKSEELLKIRALEYKDIVYDNHCMKPIEAAKFIKNGIGNIDYINGETFDDAVGLPLSQEEVSFLYLSNEKLEVEDEKVLSGRLPKGNCIWTIDEFESIIHQSSKLKEDLEFKSEIIFLENITEAKITEIYEEAIRLNSDLEGFSSLQKFLFDKTIQDSVYPSLWNGVIKSFDELFINYSETKKVQFEYDFEYSKDFLTEENLTVINEIINTGKERPITKLVAITKPKWKIVKSAIKNDGNEIQSRSEFIAVSKLLKYELDKKKLIKQINKLLIEADYQVDANDSMFEMKGNQRKELIQSSLNWYHEKWCTFVEEFSEYINDQSGCNHLKQVDYERPYEWNLEVLKLEVINAIKYKQNEISLRKLDNKYSDYLLLLEDYSYQNNLLENIIEAVRKSDVQLYKEKHKELVEILVKTDVFNRRQVLLERIKKIAPLWAEEIRNRIGIHGQPMVPDKIHEAWKWRQLSNQIERIDKYDPNKIQTEIGDINKNLLVNARKLAYESAWYEKIKNRTSVQAQAIEGWRTTIRQIGKGTGKRAPELKRKARELMPLCQSAIPVWIMPLNKVVESFDPKDNQFDVVIIDEASQSDILALAALYLGKKIIIVGDDEQVSPDSVGIKKNEVDALIELYLSGIPNSHLFNGQTSLYDMAKSSGFKPLMLTEHFRCLPEIIEFSNGLSYNGRIKPLRDSTQVSIKPPVIEYRVDNGIKNNKKINEVEAEHIASLVCAATEFDEYKGKSIGVISLLGTEQSYEIDRLLQSNINPIEYERRSIQCGTPPQFQGDERDVIFLSVVEGPTEKGGPVRLLSEDGRNDMARKRYNVAASRAKDQMWVVHSLNPEIDLKPDDIRLRLIKYSQNPESGNDDSRLKAAESPFEEEVMKALLNSGYKVIPQLKVGSYRIDMVIEDGDNRVAIECDGEKWHTQDDLPNDLKRQAILERLGWRFIRIRGSVFYRNPEETMNEVFEELEGYDIKPNYLIDEERTDDVKVITNGVIERVKIRAMELRLEWNPERYGENQSETDREPSFIDETDYDNDIADYIN